MMSAVQDILKRHDMLFDVVDAATIRFGSSYINMYSVLEVSDVGASYTCPLSYYVSDAQRDAILDMCDSNRRIPVSEYDLGAIIDGCGDSKDLPENAVFEDNRYDRMVVVHTVFDKSEIFETPEVFYDTIATVEGFSMALRNRELPGIIYDRMPKTLTDASDPRTLFYCSLMLNYRNSYASRWFGVDFNDVKTCLRLSRESVFYPSMSSDTFDGIVKEMESAIMEEISQEEPFGIIVTLTIPKKYMPEIQNVYSLRHKIGKGQVLENIYIAEDNHPFTAEMVLLKKA